MESITEPQKTTPVEKNVDVVVCGAGPAGIAAALASARSGAKTMLLEVHGCLGGVWTAGALTWIVDSRGKGKDDGIMAEIIRELEARGACRGQEKANFGYDVEVMKLLLEELCQEAGVLVQIHTRVVAAIKDDNNRLTHVITESKSGRQAWRANAFVDATGDGDLGALAGCGFDVGHPDDGSVQPMSLIGVVTGIRAEAVQPFIGGGKLKPKELLYQEILDAGVDCSYGLPVLLKIHDDLFSLVANHEYGVYAHDAAGITQATFNARREVHQIVQVLKAKGGPWENLKLVTTAAQIGVREGRRIHGQYTMTYEELLAGKKHEDAVCRVNAPLDVHSVNRQLGSTFGHHHLPRIQPYDVPSGSLIAKDVEGLFLAGRCVSGDFLAHSSYRVTGDAVPMGESAGKMAARFALPTCDVSKV